MQGTAAALRASAPRAAAKPSSHRWLQRAQRDPLAAAKSDRFVARSGHKLLELDRRFADRTGRTLVPRSVDGDPVIDLGAAPGAWIQAVRTLSTRLSVIGVDLLPLAPEVALLPGVEFVRGDALSGEVEQRVDSLLAGRMASVVLSDMVRRWSATFLTRQLANVSGNRAADAASSVELCDMALLIALRHLGPDGALVCKHYQSADAEAFERKLRDYFGDVATLRLTASRSESREAYWVCSDLREPE